jgi:hypothetical protein
MYLFAIGALAADFHYSCAKQPVLNQMAPLIWAHDHFPFSATPALVQHEIVSGLNILCSLVPSSETLVQVRVWAHLFSRLQTTVLQHGFLVCQ